MKVDIILEILDKLKDINYFFISGVAVHIYTNGERDFNDLDIAIHREDIDKFAKRLGTKPYERNMDKKTFIVQDYGFEINFKGQLVECTSGYPKIRIDNKLFEKLFNRKKVATFMGQPVFVEPIEELINQKAYMNRPKDLKDLKMLREKPNKIDTEFLEEIGRDKNNLKIVSPIIRGTFNI